MNISFALTTEQIRRRIKTETRRVSELHYNRFVLRKPRVVQAIIKGQGLKKGQHPEFITSLRIINVWLQPLGLITPDEVVREGFPNMSAHDFIGMFSTHNSCACNVRVTCIAFEYPWLVDMDNCGSIFNDTLIWGISADSVRFGLESKKNVANVRNIRPCLTKLS